LSYFTAGLDTSEGTRFAIALPRSLVRGATDQYDAEILISAKETTDVIISRKYYADDELTLPGGSSVRHHVSYTMRVSYGLEEKGWYEFRITKIESEVL